MIYFYNFVYFLSFFSIYNIMKSVNMLKRDGGSMRKGREGGCSKEDNAFRDKEGRVEAV